MRRYFVVYGKESVTLSCQLLSFKQHLSLCSVIEYFRKMAALIRRIITTAKVPAAIGPYRWEETWQLVPYEQYNTLIIAL